MACGSCGKSAAKKNVKYIYTNSKGVQTVHPSLISARAASIRDKDRGSIRTEPL